MVAGERVAGDEEGGGDDEGDCNDKGERQSNATDPHLALHFPLNELISQISVIYTLSVTKEPNKSLTCHISDSSSIIQLSVSQLSYIRRARPTESFIRNRGRERREMQCHVHPDIPLVPDYSTGSLVCIQCALVVGDRCFDVRPSTEENDHKIGPTRTMCEKRALAEAINEASTVVDRLCLPDSIMKFAKSILCRLPSWRPLLRHNKEALGAAAVYIACRQSKVPRSFNEVVAATSLCIKTFLNSHKLIVQSLHLRLERVKSVQYLPRFCGRLFLPFRIEKLATTLATHIARKDLVDTSPPVTIAAVCIHLASQKTRCVDIHDISGVPVASIRRISRQILPCVRYLLV